MAKQNIHPALNDDEIVELEDQLARHNIESSPDQEGKNSIISVISIQILEVVTNINK